MNVRPISEELQKIAKEELNEVPERIEEDIKHIKDWLSKQPHLNARTDDQWILTFLRGCKFSLQTTKQKLDMYYSIRNRAPDFFGDRDPFHIEMQRFFKKGVFVYVPLEAGTPHPKFFFGRTTEDGPDELSVSSAIKSALMLMDILLNEDDSTMNGFHLYLDAKDVDYRYVLQLTPDFARKMVSCFIDAYPIRIKKLYFLNSPQLFLSFFNLIRPIIPKKISERIEVYGGDYPQSIFDEVPPSMLPKDYGGQGLTIDELAVKISAKVESYNDWFQKDDLYNADESKRLNTTTNNNDLGVEGSFKKLNID